MAEFVLLPEAFVSYVNAHRRLPLPPDADLGTLRSLIETIALEAALAPGEAPSPAPHEVRRAAAPGRRRRPRVHRDTGEA